MLDLSPGNWPRTLAVERNAANVRALLRKLLTDGDSRPAARLTWRRTAPRAGAMPRADLTARSVALLARSRRAMHASRGARCAARLHRRGTLRSISTAHHKSCEKDAEDCLTAHEGECEQSRAPLVYVYLSVRQSVFQDADSSDNWILPPNYCGKFILLDGSIGELVLSTGTMGLAGGLSTNPLRTSANPACGSSACSS